MRYIGSNLELTVNKLIVSYTDEGPDNAPVIILIHGFPFNKSLWNKQTEVLIENFRVITYDVRGHGNSETGSEDFSIELFVNDLLGLMDALKIEKAMLCGLSMGGYIALNAIENFPKRFDALILCDTNCAADTSEIKEKRLIAIGNIERHGVEYYANESLKNLFAPESFVTSLENIAWVKEMIMGTSVKSLSGTLIALYKRKDTCDKLAGIAVPVLIVVGEKDKITPPDTARLMQRKIKGSILNIIEHAGHLCNIENDYEFNIQLMKFIYSVYQRPDKYMRRDRLVSEVFNSRKITENKRMVKDLNSKIQRITITIKNHYPELSKHLNEIQEPFPSEENQEILLNQLSNYYESMNSMLNKYKKEYHKTGE
jgi:3-oxoadipate enol-lactonase